MGKELDRFIDIVARLRAPDGCPWDREQTSKSLLSSLIEESYEFFEAVDSGDRAKMREELGDLLLQVILHAQIADDEGAFNLEDVARAISEKIIRRHPHVFGDAKVDSSKDVVHNWEKIKRTETSHRERTSLVDGIPEALPALLRAEKVQRRVARMGFDWTDMKPVLDKVEEEFGEFRRAVETNDHPHAEEELGDILFALVNVARHRDICAEDALRATARKFARRFRYIEDRFRETGKDINAATLEEMDAFWVESKGVVG
jgi:tetrapyrrole methylase family protein/MazG family protein